MRSCIPAPWVPQGILLRNNPTTRRTPAFQHPSLISGHMLTCRWGLCCQQQQLGCSCGGRSNGVFIASVRRNACVSGYTASNSDAQMPNTIRRFSREAYPPIVGQHPRTYISGQPPQRSIKHMRCGVLSGSLSTQRPLTDSLRNRFSFSAFN